MRMIVLAALLLTVFACKNESSTEKKDNVNAEIA